MYCLSGYLRRESENCRYRREDDQHPDRQKREDLQFRLESTDIDASSSRKESERLKAIKTGDELVITTELKAGEEVITKIVRALAVTTPKKSPDAKKE